MPRDESVNSERETTIISVRRSMKLWDGVFRSDCLEDVATANEVTQQVTARTLLQLYRNNEVRMSSVTVESLRNFLHSKGKAS